MTPPEADGRRRRDYLLFPSAEAILTELLPSYVRNAVYRALVETAAGEQGARRTAMKNATDNASDMLNVLRAPTTAPVRRRSRRKSPRSSAAPRRSNSSGT